MGYFTGKSESNLNKLLDGANNHFGTGSFFHWEHFFFLLLVYGLQESRGWGIVSFCIPGGGEENI